MAKINSCIGIVLVLSVAAACAHADAAGVSVTFPGREPVPVEYTGARLAVNF